METPSHSILICATPRSGSYLLCEALRSTHRAGDPEEYLWRPNAERFAVGWGVDADDAQAYRAAMLDAATSEQGVFACKVMWGYVSAAARVLREQPWGDPTEANIEDAALLVDALPNATFVFMRRRDVVAQAISYSRAVQADAWARMDDGSEVPGDVPVLDDAASVRRPAGTPPPVAYDFHQIEYFREELERHNECWAELFAGAGIEPVDIAYEDLAADYEGVARHVLQSAGIDTTGITFGARRLQRQRDHVSRRWRLRYEEDRHAHVLSDTPRAGALPRTE